MYSVNSRQSIRNILSNIYGGIWRYNNESTWICNDNLRTVSRIKTCDCDSKCNCPNSYFLYGNGTPIKVNLF
jgi:hypothetical protein